MENKKTLFVDMDDVIVKGGLLYLINKFLNTNYEEKDFDGFYMQDVIPMEKRKEFFDFVKNENVYEHGTMLEGCKEVLKELNEKYNLFISTSYIWREIPTESGKVLVQKFEYLTRELPFITPYQYIFISDKTVLNADIMIDDRPKNLINAKRKLLFSAFHNLSVSDEELKKLNITRVNSWDEIKKILL